VKTFTIEDIRSWDPCYDPVRHLAEDWSGTALDILRDEKMPVASRFWVVLRTEVLDKKTLRLFAVWCARSVQHLMQDQRSINAIDIAEKFANGEATEEELETARAEAWAAWETMRKVSVAAGVVAAVVAQAVEAQAAEHSAAMAADAAVAAEAFGAARVAGAAVAAEAAAAAVAARVAGAVGAARKQSRNAQVAHLIKMLEQS